MRGTNAIRVSSRALKHTLFTCTYQSVLLSMHLTETSLKLFSSQIYTETYKFCKFFHEQRDNPNFAFWKCTSCNLWQPHSSRHLLSKQYNRKKRYHAWPEINELITLYLTNMKSFMFSLQTNKWKLVKHQHLPEGWHSAPWFTDKLGGVSFSAKSTCQNFSVKN